MTADTGSLPAEEQFHCMYGHAITMAGLLKIKSQAHRIANLEAQRSLDQAALETANAQIAEWVSANGPCGWIDELRKDKERLEYQVQFAAGAIARDALKETDKLYCERPVTPPQVDQDEREDPCHPDYVGELFLPAAVIHQSPLRSATMDTPTLPTVPPQDARELIEKAIIVMEHRAERHHKKSIKSKSDFWSQRHSDLSKESDDWIQSAREYLDGAPAEQAQPAAAPADRFRDGFLHAYHLLSTQGQEAVFQEGDKIRAELTKATAHE